MREYLPTDNSVFNTLKHSIADYINSIGSVIGEDHNDGGYFEDIILDKQIEGQLTFEQARELFQDLKHDCSEIAALEKYEALIQPFHAGSRVDFQDGDRSFQDPFIPGVLVGDTQLVLMLSGNKVKASVILEIEAQETIELSVFAIKASSDSDALEVDGLRLAKT